MPHPFDVELQALEAIDERPPTAHPRNNRAWLINTASPPPGQHSLWDIACRWLPEADAPSPKPPSTKLEEIALELKLKTLSTPKDIARARRQFMWDNHPDRRRDLNCDVANRRVALANMLLDRAQRRLKAYSQAG